MITREEYDIKIEPSSVHDDDSRDDVLEKFYIFECNTNNYIYSLEQHIKQLEAQLSNTEQLTCDGCIYHGCNYDVFQNTCKKCGRIQHMTDYYTTKDTK